MIEVTVSRKKVEALKESLKTGDKVTYYTPVAEFLDNTNKGSKQAHKARIVKKLKYLAVIEYNAKRGKEMVKAQSTMTYNEIYFQRHGAVW